MPKKRRPELRILIADDEGIVRLDLRQMLEQRGYQVAGEAGDGEAAVELAAKTKPDLAILDVKMPKLSGLEAAKRLLTMEIPTVLLTAYADGFTVRKALEAGVYAYVVKPFSEKDLRPAIELALHQHKQVRGLRESLALRKIVERAKGILMEQTGLSEDEAHRRLLQISMEQRRPLREVAKQIVESRALERS